MMSVYILILKYQLFIIFILSSMIDIFFYSERKIIEKLFKSKGNRIHVLLRKKYYII